MATLQERVQKARAAGFSDAAIEDSLKRQGLLKTASSPAVKEKKKFELTDLIPAATSTVGAVGGGLLGALAGGVGAVPGAIGGGAAGGAAGEWIRQKLTPGDDDSFGDVVREGGIGGMFGAIPGGGSLAKVALKGASAGVGANLISKVGKEEITADDLFKSALFGAAGGAAAKGVGDTASRFTRKMADASGKASKTLRVNAINPTKSQQADFKQGQKMSVKKAVDTYGVNHKLSTVDEAIKPRQERFTQIAEDPRLQIHVSDIGKRITPKYQTLEASLSGTDNKIANKIIEESRPLMKRLAEGQGYISAKELNNLIQRFDVNINFDKFPKQANALRDLRTALRAAMQDVSDASGLATAGELKTLGKELSTLKALREIVRINEFGQAKSLPGAGYAGAAFVGGTAAAINPVLGLPGAIGGSMAGNLTKNKGFVNKMADMQSGISKNLSKAEGAYPKTMAPSNFIAQMAGGAMEEDDQDPEQTGVDPSMDTGMDMTETAPQYEDVKDVKGNAWKRDAQGTLYSPDLAWKYDSTKKDWVENQTAEAASGEYTIKDFQDMALKALKAGDTKGLARIKSVYDTFYKDKEGEGKLELSDSAIKNVSDIQGAISDVDKLKVAIEENNLTGPIKGVLGKFPYATESQSLQARLDRVRQVVGKALEGGVLRKEDEEKYKKILPTMMDTEEVAIFKLEQLQQKLNLDLEKYVGLQKEYGKGRGLENILGGSSSSQSSDMSNFFAE